MRIPFVPYLQLMSDQNHRLPLQLLLNAVLKDVLPHVSVHGRQRVVQEEDVLVGVDGSGQADPLLLTPRQVQASLADLRGVREDNQSDLRYWKMLLYYGKICFFFASQQV